MGRSTNGIVRSVCAAMCALALLLLTRTGVAAQDDCGGAEGFDRLDFWVGEWEVFAGERQVGTNRIAKILNGCAVTEEWTSAQGGQGRSLFYYLPRSGEWKQVWVTNTATRTGGVKEKTLVEVLDDGALHFLGRVLDDADVQWYDRTTLTPLPDGDVRQVIEISRDGETWETIFDATYVRRGS